MAEYYKNRPPAVAVLDGPAENNDLTSKTVRNMSDFDKHRQTLLANDVQEGPASELRRYLGTMQRDVNKDTDIVEWWQVSNSVD